MSAPSSCRECGTAVEHLDAPVCPEHPDAGIVRGYGPRRDPVVSEAEAQASWLALAARQRAEGLLSGDDDADPFVGITRPAWRDFARCRGMDPELFHPGRGHSADPARAVCAGCPVRQPCLDHALGLGQAARGVWGGTSERERRGLRRERAA